MKKAVLFLALLLLLSLTACGQTAEPTPTASPSAAPATVAEAVPTTEPSPAAEASPVAEAAPSPMEVVQSLIGQNVDALFAAIGEPADMEYAQSCNGPGDDGWLYYDGFTVFTYRENDTETVVDVEAD